MANGKLIGKTFVELADTLVDDYDPIEFLHLLTARCAELLDVSDVGVCLADDEGRLNVLASSSERMRLIELIEVQREDGPCLDVWRTGVSVHADRLKQETERWPIFAPAALEAGFRSVYALPLRLRERRLGALNLFADHPHAMSGDDTAIGQALADVATIGILHERFLREHQTLAEQLQIALTNRITLEQAKGVVAEQSGIDVDEAFVVLRTYARHHNRRLTEVAADIVHHSLKAADLPIAPRSARD